MTMIGGQRNAARRARRREAAARPGRATAPIGHRRPPRPDGVRGAATVGGASTPADRGSLAAWSRRRSSASRRGSQRSIRRPVTQVRGGLERRDVDEQKYAGSARRRRAETRAPARARPTVPRPATAGGAERDHAVERAAAATAARSRRPRGAGRPSAAAGPCAIAAGSRRSPSGAGRAAPRRSSDTAQAARHDPDLAPELQPVRRARRARRPRRRARRPAGGPGR